MCIRDRSIGTLIQRGVNQFAALSFKTLLGQAKVLQQRDLAQLFCTILSNILRTRIDDCLLYTSRCV